jgi:radical SAM superfamily enzyme YgiQ (UPF0313 family)
MDIKLIIPPNFYVADEMGIPPLQYEPFYHFAAKYNTDIDIIHLKRGDSLSIIPESEMYGMSVYTQDVPIAEVIAYHILRGGMTRKIAVGGYHPSARPKEMSSLYDYVVVGPGEPFIMDVLANNLPDERVVTNTVRWSRFNALSHDHFELYFKEAYTIRLSYGCYLDCNFCVKRPVIFRDLDDIHYQLDFLANKGIKRLRVIDDICTQHPHFNTICRLLSEFEWSTQTRLNLLTQEKAVMMKNNGCEMVQVGIESFDEGVRNRLNKKLPNKKLYEGIHHARDNGLKLQAFLMFGTPFDTEDTIKYSLMVSKKYLLDGEARPQVFVPYPGTAIGDDPGAYNLRLLTTEPQYYSTIPFQNTHGRIVCVPSHVKDVDAWERILRETIYELTSYKEVIDNPIDNWHTDYYPNLSTYTQTYPHMVSAKNHG